MACPGMIAVGMSDYSTIHFSSRINIKITCGAVDTLTPILQNITHLYPYQLIKLWEYHKPKNKDCDKDW
jgi:hypothetical protein